MSRRLTRPASGERELWNQLAPYYDALYGFTTDLEFWRVVIERWAGERSGAPRRVLELGGGTGRVSVHLAQCGHAVDCVEESPRMREVAISKRTADIADRFSVLSGDIANLKLRRKYDAIICPFNTWAVILESSRRVSGLRRVHEHLAHAGILVLDFWQKNLQAVQPQGWALWDYETGRRYNPAEGTNLFWSEHAVVNRKLGLERIELHITDASGLRPRNITGVCTVKLLSRPQVEAELERAGFECLHVYGDYSCGAWSPDSPQELFVARRR